MKQQTPTPWNQPFPMDLTPPRPKPKMPLTPNLKSQDITAVAVGNAIIVQLSRIMSVILTGNVWSVSPRVMCGDDYAIICWREVMFERSAVRRQEINTPSSSNVALAFK